LRDEDVDEEEWAHWETARSKGGIHDWLGMHNLYLATDVLALADIIERFRTSFREIYGIVPAPRPAIRNVF
jgi:hypothetical protein